MFHLEFGGYEKRLSIDDSNAKIFVEFVFKSDALAFFNEMNGKQLYASKIICEFIDEN